MRAWAGPVNSRRSGAQANTGEALQVKIQDAGKLLTEDHPGFMDRIYDSKSARGFIPERPGDFYLLLYGRSFLIEAKSSLVHASLAKASLKSLIKPHQITSSRLWTRAGGISVFVFHHLTAKEVEIWAGPQVVQAYLQKKVKLTEPWHRCPYTAAGIAGGFLHLIQHENDHVR